MSIINPKFLLFFFVFSIFISSIAHAQGIPADLSNVSVDDLSDAQVNRLVQQAHSSGLNDQQLLQMAEERGLQPAEAQKLRQRITSLKKNNATDNQYRQKDGLDSGRRKLNYAADTDSVRSSRKELFADLVPRVFGSEIFRNTNMTFAPDLKLATPKNYVIGPEDELDINVYGNSLANWKLDVSPDGNINIPGVGVLNVGGSTIEQATSRIKERLRASHYSIGNGTSLQISLGNIRSIKVILIGELIRPGTYTLPSLATAFNALYAAGGPNTNGSFRQIEIIRNNKVIRTLDIYDFLTRGDQKDNINLQDQDIIRVPTYRLHVEMAGEIKHPAIFETLPGETLADLIRFAGGFTDQAYTNLITVTQVSDQQRRMSDVTEADFRNYVPLRGDKYTVKRILNRFENRVTIRGAVFRPGEYELDKGLTISGLISKAAGLKEEAFTGRGIISRLNPDNSRRTVAFNLQAITNKTSPDIALQREDSVYIASVFELRDKYTLVIKGGVRKPGQYIFADSTTVADLIIKAGGFTEGGSGRRIEVGRRVTDSDPNAPNGKVAIVYSVNVDEGLKQSTSDFILQPYDIVSVYTLPGYEQQRTVRVEGEVLYPGYYTLQRKDEKISDIIKRAGNLTVLADADGSSLKRTNSAILNVDKSKSDSAALLRESNERLQRLHRLYRDSSTIDTQARNNYIGIDLRQILKKPGSVTDLIMEDGDVIRVPKQQQVVKVNGEVLYPSVVVYEKGRSFRDFVLNAGGFSPQALKRGAYIVYPNGTVKGTRKFLFFNSYPNVKPGSEIYVPKKPPARSNTATELIALTTGLASLGAIILGIISLHK